MLRQACFDGVIDLSEARPLDRHWRRKLRWALDAVELNNLKQLTQMKHALHCGALTYLAGKKTLDTHWEQAIEQQDRMDAMLFPWLAKAGSAGSYQKLTSYWEKAYGKLSDPETQRKLAAAVETLNKRTRRGRRGEANAPRRRRTTAQ